MITWEVTANNSGMLSRSNCEKMARASFTTHCDHAARRSGETVTLWRDGARVAEFSGISESARFLAYCLDRADNCDSANARDWWARLAGNVRKSGTM